ncbi:MAG TPA: hypothetical protein VEU06_07790 [Micropepsaceae bacterium]|nr:hypothetical protein [Micropepsaceae bacterium]
MSDFSYLPPLARAKRYRALAQDARNEAAKFKGAIQESYLLSAEKWDKMAAELERDLKWTDGDR